MIAKSKEGEDHLVNLRRLFERLKKYKLRLNPAKCTFGAKSGKLLGFVVSERGIEVDPDKVKAIRELPPPSTVREVRSFLGRLNYIARFIANLSDKCQPLFRLLRKNAAIEWDDDCQKAFDDIKTYLVQSPVLVPPTPGQWKTKDAKLVPYHEYLEELAENFEKISFTYTPRIKNQFTDALATLASMVSITKENLIEPLEIEIAKGPTYCDTIEATDEQPCFSLSYPQDFRIMDPRLYRCARRGNVRSLKRLLDETPSLILGLTPQENSIIHIASRFGHVSVVQEICTRCKSLLTKPNIDGDTPLHVAARAGQLGVVSSLLKQMIEEPAFDIESGRNCRLKMVMWKNKRDNTALHVAIGNGHLQAAELLLEVNPQLVHYANHDGESPLYLAARGGMVEIVNRILMFPSAPSGGCHGQTALHAAVIERNPGIVQSLLRVRPELINAMDHEGRNAVHYAASSGEHKMVEKLLEFDFSSAYATDRNGHSPLQAAALLGHTKVISGILRHCPDSGEFLDLKGQNALHLAVLGGKAKVVSRMLEMEELEGLINQPDKNGNTPLHLAAVERNTWIMRYLLWDGRVDRKARNMSGLTALDFVKPIQHPNRVKSSSCW
ncbi:protein ACCELERATED CELL DEATH 6-like [Punica granatum]|uniref:Protein ACCELERATED CELL DEATH 6-like n=1 Tax=Punica granatum TaxID=22663 RepID=A0A6P8E775_PUNGR|nr:protein ACCELERATED CELL DEATH 6-like [Punica granatum]